MTKKSSSTLILPQGRVLTWDIETTDFKADFGNMLMWAAKFTDEEDVYYARIDESSTWRENDPESRVDDREIVSQLVDLIEEADVLVHHYGDKFDWPFLVTRCLANGLEPPAPKSTVDTCKVARYGLKLTSNRLANVADFLNGEDAQKGSLSKKQWKLAAQGHGPTLDAMLEYCISDVVATEQAYLKMRKIIKHHPHIAPIYAGADQGTMCPACGSAHTHGHSHRRTKRTIQHRRKCQNCGHVFIAAQKIIPIPRAA